MTEPATLPYPFDKDWGLWRPRSRGARLSALIAGIAFAALGAWLIIVFVMYYPTSSDASSGWIVVGILASLCAAGIVGKVPRGMPGPPQLINAVTLMKGDDRISDDWAHFFRGRPDTLIGSVLWVLAALVCVPLGVLVLVTRSINGDDEDDAFVWVLGLVVVCVIVGLVGGGDLVHRFRYGHFGRLQTGLLLSRTGVAYRDLTRFITVAWDDIDDVLEPGASRSSMPSLPPPGGADDGHKKQRQQAPWWGIVGRFESDGDDYTSDLSDPLGGYDQHPWLIYAAIRFYWQNPALRTELGTTKAQTRFEQWNDAIVAQLTAELSSAG